MADEKRPLYLASFWGVAGFVALIAQALFRMTPMAVEPLDNGMMEPMHWAITAGWVAFMLYSEAYKGFHLAFSPRLASRAMYLAENPRPLHVLLAPAYVMGLVHATRKRLMISWCLLIGIVGLVLAVRQLEQPWRGIVDSGVIIGLLVGTGSVLWHVARVARGGIRADPDVPGSQ